MKNPAGILLAVAIAFVIAAPLLVYAFPRKADPHEIKPEKAPFPPKTYPYPNPPQVPCSR
jgi:hypothetical protein